MSSSLSKEQLYAFERFKKGDNLFITGAGGTGKTHLIHTLIEYANMKGLNYQVCAMTGCAAVLLNCGARTLHSWSGIKGGNGKSAQIISNVLQNRYAVAAWKKIRILIVDEVSMMSEKIFDILCAISQDTRQNTGIFGRIQVIFTGDFYQLPPVGNPYDESTSKFCFQSDKWFDVFPLENHIELRTIFRQTDPIYCNILSQIRKGTLDEESCEILKSYVKREYAGQVPTKLFATRERTDYVNNAMFSNLQEAEVVFPCIRKMDYKTILETGEAFSPIQLGNCEKMKTTQKTEISDHLIANTNCAPTLSLKRGAIVMCTVNLDLDQNICNGSQGVIIDFCNGVLDDSQIPIVRFTNGVVKQMEYHYWQSEEFPCIVVGQYPLCLAWALTIHKIQGATLNLAEIDIGNSIFEYGQTYVALSRVKNLEGLYLSAFNPYRIKANPMVKQFYSLVGASADAEMDKWLSVCLDVVDPVPFELEAKVVDGIFDKFAYKEDAPNEDKTTKRVCISGGGGGGGGLTKDLHIRKIL